MSVMPYGDYVLPLRWSDDAGLDELTAYLTWLGRHMRVIVVDGSPAPLFAGHARAWGGIACHVPPDPDLGFVNGKVNGVVTGMRRATADLVVIADDDVRYDHDGLCSLLGLLEKADLVRPQNYFDPLPWHARWDTSRTLLNRSLGADYPGTFGIRRATFEAMGGYDGDTLFENLELIRTVRAYGGSERRANDLFVRRLPPQAGRFWNQRVRQAYDEFAQPVRMALFLGIVPGLLYALVRRRHRVVITAALATVALAETGRRRGRGTQVFPAGAALMAPAWALERGVCSWLAVAARLGGGVPYAGHRVKTAAHSMNTLRRRFRRRREASVLSELRSVSEPAPRWISRHATCAKPQKSGPRSRRYPRVRVRIPEQPRTMLTTSVAARSVMAGYATAVAAFATRPTTVTRARMLAFRRTGSGTTWTIRCRTLPNSASVRPSPLTRTVR